jgi:hypothetical protein
MKPAVRKAKFTAIGAAILVGGTFTAALASAQASSDNWQYRAVIYGYLPDLNGSTTFPAGAGSSIDVDAEKIISHLKFTVMGSFEAQKGRWGAFTDVMYLNVGGSKSGTRDLAIGGAPLRGGVTANGSLDIEGLVWTLAGNYRAVSSPEMGVDIFAGARLIDLKQKLGWEFSADVGPFTGPGRQGSSQVKLDNWDGVVGAKGRLYFGANRQWFLPYYLDVGAGESHLTWQGIAGVGYVFNWGELIATWRYLDYDFKSGKKIESLNFNGPALGVAFRW